MGDSVTRILIVDDEPLVLRSVERVVSRGDEFEILLCASPKEAVQFIPRIEGQLVVLFDICIPTDSDCIPLVMAARARHPPAALVAMSVRASRSMIAKLMKLGVQEYWEKGSSPGDLRAKLSVVAAELGSRRGSDIQVRTLAAAEVGMRSLREAQTALGDAMIRAALQAANGNRSLAARLLGVTPQAIRHRERAQKQRTHGQG